MIVFQFDLISAGNNIKAVYWFQDNLVQSYTRGNFNLFTGILQNLLVVVHT